MPSSASKIDIFNMALGFVGTRSIASEAEKTPEAVQCNLYWDRARRAALRDYPYGFALRREKLAAKPLPEAYAGSWQYAYGLPDGCLKVHRLVSAGGRAPFCLESESTGAILLCNVNPAIALTTFDVEDVSRFDELFVLAMARKLASLVAVPLLKNNQGKLQELETLYARAIPESEAQDASERVEHDAPDSWLCARESW